MAPRMAGIIFCMKRRTLARSRTIKVSVLATGAALSIVITSALTGDSTLTAAGSVNVTTLVFKFTDICGLT